MLNYIFSKRFSFYDVVLIGVVSYLWRGHNVSLAIAVILVGAFISVKGEKYFGVAP